MGRVVGTVTSTISRERGEPVPGVLVHLPDVPLSTTSGSDGRFELPIAPAGVHHLRAELLGCELVSRRIEVPSGGTTRLDLKVVQPVIELDGLVATTASREVDHAAHTYSIERLDIEEHGAASRRSIADLIRSRFPGVKVVEGSGLSGEEVSIQLRGPTSIAGSHEPLIVVDGVLTSGGLVDINPEDVVDIRVLKGAAAAAEYGSRGAGGVLEISTQAQAEERDSVAWDPPHVVVDGRLVGENFNELGAAAVETAKLITGAAAGVLFGRWAQQTGVVSITTRDRFDERGGDSDRRCVLRAR